MNEKSQLPRSFLDECESLAIKLAPELAAAPVYVCNAPSESLETDCIAYCPVGAPDFPLRDSLIAEGKWNGPGTAVVFCEQLERDEALAKKFIEQSDPLAKLKDEFKEIDRLLGTGDLTSDQAKKAKDKETKDFNAANHKDNRVEFRSADQSANDMLAKSLENADIQKEQRDLLKQINDKIGKPQAAVMV
jgi:hypothetical protein